MPQGLILIVPALLIVIGLVLLGVALSVLVSAVRTYRRGQDARSRTRPQPLSQLLLIATWSALVLLVGGLVTGAGAIIVARVLAE